MLRPLLPRSLATLLACSGLALIAPPAMAQKVVPKIGTICPLGYVDLFNGKCSNLGAFNYTVTPTNGKACLEGWMNVGGGYCRRKN
ncbi:hypothetical protein [Cyanobium sp. NS01]|uniref:hypothetical protein n=1 Tax=unclassified Cyanobium TaxID=2627006 RepID=UPI001CECAA40|nr:hypothetical protein [Cyanobium sp. NS01]